MSRRLWLCGSFAALGVVAQGCVDNEISFFIEQAQIPQATGTTGCTLSSDPNTLHRNQGLLDVSVRSTFVMYPLYRSEILAYDRRVSGRPEVRGMFVDGANVELHVGNEMGLPPSGLAGNLTAYQVVSTTYIDPASTEGPGFSVGNLEIIPAQVGAAVARQICQPITTDVSAACPIPRYPDQSLAVVAVIRPFGHTMGGIQVSGSHFVFPVTFCCHCLVQFDSASDNPAIAGPDCNSSTGMAVAACDPGQDDPVDCRTCALGNPLACQPRGFQNGGVGACPL